MGKKRVDERARMLCGVAVGVCDSRGSEGEGEANSEEKKNDACVRSVRGGGRRLTLELVTRGY